MEVRNPDLRIGKEGCKDIGDAPEGKLFFIWVPQICPALSMLKIALNFASTIENSFRFRRYVMCGVCVCVCGVCVSVCESHALPGIKPRSHGPQPLTVPNYLSSTHSPINRN